VLGRHLGEVGILAGELLHDRFGGLGDGLRVERQGGLLQRESVDVAVEQGIGVRGHGHRETGLAQGSEGGVGILLLLLGFPQAQSSDYDRLARNAPPARTTPSKTLTP
jgi:hypothetical protein